MDTTCLEIILWTSTEIGDFIKDVAKLYYDGKGVIDIASDHTFLENTSIF